MNDFANIEVFRSNGNSGAVASVRENLLFPDNFSWPPIELLTKMVRSGKIRHFSEPAKSLLQKELGYYCDLQSIKSEDAITWSLFGYMSLFEPEIQKKFYLEFLNEIGLEKDDLSSIKLWKRLPHPQKINCKNGSEIDVLLTGKKYYFLIECKWASNIGKKQGLNSDLNQIEIRNLFINSIGKKLFPGKKGKTVFVGNYNLQNIQSITWEKFSEFKSLPHREVFKAYISWKKQYI